MKKQTNKQVRRNSNLYYGQVWRENDNTCQILARLDSQQGSSELVLIK